ncbi:MAG: sugar phosphate isomerase/epimerase [Candidatus Marinimicrobia bacterium]|nr:sugar phosphate isomerase/epimerase [Candidatus Neomarinimicrobiota bacterium]
MKLGVITDGINRDLEHALKVMNETGLEYAELQFVWDKEIGDQTPEEIQKIKNLITKYNVKVPCITRHNFVGMSVLTTEPEDEPYQKHFDGLKRCIKIAKELGTNMVRIMSFRKEMIIFGHNGAEKWVASTGSWEKLLKLMEAPIQLAEDEGITLAVETGNNAMITSGWLGRKLIDDLGTKRLKLIWDIPNTLYCTEIPYPDAYEEVKDILGHIHIKDCKSNISRATVQFCPLGKGDMAPYLEDIANALKRDRYQGVISLESVYRPDNGSFEDGFRECLPAFRKLFAN